MLLLDGLDMRVTTAPASSVACTTASFWCREEHYENISTPRRLGWDSTVWLGGGSINWAS